MVTVDGVVALQPGINDLGHVFSEEVYNGLLAFVFLEEKAYPLNVSTKYDINITRTSLSGSTISDIKTKSTTTSTIFGIKYKSPTKQLTNENRLDD